jgi:hypothetical protein
MLADLMPLLTLSLLPCHSMADVEDNYADIQEEIEEYQEQQEEEEEIEEIEDLLEYYLQKAGAVQSEAERLLEGA